MNAQRTGGNVHVKYMLLIYHEAIAIAARIPMARKGTVEVRPVVEIAGLPTG